MVVPWTVLCCSILPYYGCFGTFGRGRKSYDQTSLVWRLVLGYNRGSIRVGIFVLSTKKEERIAYYNCPLLSKLATFQSSIQNRQSKIVIYTRHSKLATRNFSLHPSHFINPPIRIFEKIQDGVVKQGAVINDG